MMAVRAGVTSLEHGSEATDELFHEMRKRGTIYVPTLAAMEKILNGEIEAFMVKVKTAHKLGVRIAAGGDTGVFAHGENARELELLVKAGIPVEHVLEACTIGGWEVCGGEKCGFRFGWFEKGCRADIIALESDPRKDIEALRRVGFVMKDGRVWKRDGVPVGVLQMLVDEAPAVSPAVRDGWVLV
jgi:imidazolonepropionase-like amidohydrolase